jgi:hypothetical protein
MRGFAQRMSKHAVQRGAIICGTITAGIVPQSTALCAAPNEHPGPTGAVTGRHQAHDVASPWLRQSDVLMRFFIAKPDQAEFETANSFHVTKAVWSYVHDADYIRRVHAAGWAFQGTVGPATRNRAHALREDDGEPAPMPHRPPGSFIADLGNPAYKAWYIEKLVRWSRLGVDAIQRDNPLAYRRFSVAAASRFLAETHAEFRRRIERPVPMSTNAAWNRSSLQESGWPVIREFDFVMTELMRKHVTVDFFAGNEREGRRKRRVIAYTAGEQLSKRQHRLATSASYATGANYIVPWDQYTGPDTQRYFAEPEQYADLYALVRASAPYLDGYGPFTRLDPRRHRLADRLANELFGGRGFTVFMVSRSQDGRFGLSGNSANAEDARPRLEMLRRGLSYNLAAPVTGRSTAEALEITSFMHDGDSTATLWTNCAAREQTAGPDYAVQRRFADGFLSIPHQGGGINHPGELAELLVYDSPLTDQDFEAVCAALTDKYLIGQGGDSPKTSISTPPRLHLDAATLSETHEDGAPVERWRAATGQVAVVPNVALPNGQKAGAPSFKLRGLAEHPAVAFDGVDDLLRVEDGVPEYRNDVMQIVGGSGSLHAFGREKPGDSAAPKVIHLIDWSRRPKPATLTLAARHFFGAGSTLMLWRPAPYDPLAHAAAERSAQAALQASQRRGPAQAPYYETLIEQTPLRTAVSGERLSVELPALKPWGLIIVSRPVPRRTGTAGPTKPGPQAH